MTRGAGIRTHRVVARRLHRLAICLRITGRGCRSRRGTRCCSCGTGGWHGGHTHLGGTIEVHGSRTSVGLANPTSVNQSAVDILATGRIRVISDRVFSLRLNRRTVSGCRAGGRWCRCGGAGGAAHRGCG